LKNASQELLHQIEQYLAPKGHNCKKVYIAKTFKNMNDWPECLDICHGASFWQEVSSLFKLGPWVHKWVRPKEKYFYNWIYSKNL